MRNRGVQAHGREQDAERAEGGRQLRDEAVATERTLDGVFERRHFERHLLRVVGKRGANFRLETRGGDTGFGAGDHRAPAIELNGKINLVFAPVTQRLVLDVLGDPDDLYRRADVGPGDFLPDWISVPKVVLGETFVDDDRLPKDVVRAGPITLLEIA